SRSKQIGDRSRNGRYRPTRVGPVSSPAAPRDADVGAHPYAVLSLPEPEMDSAAKVVFVTGLDDLVFLVGISKVTAAAEHERHAFSSSKRGAAEMEKHGSVDNQARQCFGGRDIGSRLRVAGQPRRDLRTRHENAPFDRDCAREIHADQAVQAY